MGENPFPQFIISLLLSNDFEIKVDFHGRGEYNYVRCPGSRILLGSYHVTPTFPIPGGDTQARLVK
jgi:hypothetical protein